MKNKKTIDYLIIASSILLIFGILNNNKSLNLFSFLALIIFLIIKNMKKNINIHLNRISNINKNIHKTNSKRTSLDKVQFFKEYMDFLLEEDYNFCSNLYSYFDNNCCPNCGCVLDNKILSSKKCPECKEKIVLRTNKITSKKLLLSEKRTLEYDKHDGKRSEIIYFENIIAKRQYVYNSYMSKFYELKSTASDPRNVVYPFVNYVGSQLDSDAYKKYMKIINLSEQDMALESFEVIRQFNLANMQYFLLAEIADYKGHKDIALDIYATAAYRGVQISILDGIANPYHENKTIDIMGNVFPGMILKFLNKSGYSLEDFKRNFLQNRHPFILKQISNEESWDYVCDTIKLYKDMEAKR